MNTEIGHEFATENVWKLIRRISESSVHKKVASAYLGGSVDFHWNSGDILLLGLSEKSVVDGLIDIDKVMDLIEAGVKVYKQENLHAKIYFNNEMAVVCSCNLSGASQREWLEAGLATTDFKTLESIKKFFDDYATEDKLVTVEILEALKLIKKELDKEEDESSLFKINERVWAITTVPSQKEDPATEAAINEKMAEAKRKIDESKVTLFNIKLISQKFFSIKPGDFIIRFTKNDSGIMLYPLYKCIQASFVYDKLYYINLTQQSGLESKKWEDVRHLFEVFNLENHNGEVIHDRNNLIQSLLLLFSF